MKTSQYFLIVSFLLAPALYAQSSQPSGEFKSFCLDANTCEIDPEQDLIFVHSMDTRFIEGWTQSTRQPAQPVKRAPSFFKDWKSMAGVALLAGAQILDGKSTSDCNPCTETRPSFGKHPSTGRIVGVEISGFVWFVFLHSLNHRLGANDRNPWWKALSYTGIPLPVSGIILSGAVANLENAPSRAVPKIRCPKTLVC